MGPLIVNCDAAERNDADNVAVYGSETPAPFTMTDDPFTRRETDVGWPTQVVFG